MNKKLILFLLIIIGAFSSDKIYAQEKKTDQNSDSNQEILKRFQAFFDATAERDSRKMVEYIYPKLFELVPKETLIQSMDKANENSEMNIVIRDSKIGEISSEITIDEIKYAIIPYSFLLVMEEKEKKISEEEDEKNNMDALDFVKQIFQGRHGEENVFYDKKAGRLEVNIITKAIAVKENATSEWTFIEYKPKGPILEIIPKEILEKAAPAAKSCKECESFKDALVQPEIVTSLIISRYLQGVKLDEFPKSIGQLKNLKILYLTGHSFTSVPKEIGNLQKLEELSLAECPLTSLPEEIFTLTNLKELLFYEHNFSEKYLEEIKIKFREKMPKTKVEFE